MAATIARREPRGLGHDLHGDPADGQGATCRPNVSARRAAGVDRAGAQPFVEEALRWLPDEARRASARERRPSAASADRRGRARRESCSPTTTPTCATTCARLLERHYEVDAVADGAAALDAIRPTRPGPRPHRRHDAAPRRLRPARKRSAPTRDPLAARDHAVRARRRGGAHRGRRRPAPTTTSSSRSARASCSLASPRSSRLQSSAASSSAALRHRSEQLELLSRARRSGST